MGLAYIGTLCGGLSTGIVQVLILAHNKSQTYLPKKYVKKLALMKINK